MPANRQSPYTNSVESLNKVVGLKEMSNFTYQTKKPMKTVNFLSSENPSTH